MLTELTAVAALGRAEAELKKEAALEAQAEERRRIAEEAVAEAAALAAERDQVLEEIAGLRGLEDQAGLLQEAEAELADLDGRLQEAQSGRGRFGRSLIRWTVIPLHDAPARGTPAPDPTDCRVSGRDSSRAGRSRRQRE